MLIALAPKQYNQNAIIFADRVKNNILSNAYFYRLYYSDEHFTSNGLYIYFTLTNVKIEKYFNKIKCIFDKYKNTDIVAFLKKLEVTILQCLPTHTNKILVYQIEEQLNNHFIKIFSNTECPTILKNIDILLKISGIWENSGEYGITFRFYVNHPS